MKSLRSLMAAALLAALSIGSHAEELAIGKLWRIRQRHAVPAWQWQRATSRKKASTSPASSPRPGGGTSLRNMLAGGGVPYGEVNPGVIVSAILAGADLKIVSDNVLTVAEFVWAVKKDSPIKTIKDIKGKKIGYTNPRSTSQALDIMLLQIAGYKPDDAELVKTGGFGEGVAALESGQIDIAPITEPLWSKYKDKYRAVVVAQRRPPAARQCGRRGDRRNGREKGRFHPRCHPRAPTKPSSSCASIRRRPPRSSPRNTTSSRRSALSAVKNLTTSTTKGVPYWGEGEIHLEGHQAHDRGAALGRRHQWRGRLQQDYRQPDSSRMT